VRSYFGGRVVIDWAGIAVAEPLVRSLVARVTGRDPGPLHHTCPFCGSVEHGRPYVDAPVHVSVAHATGMTVVAVSTAGPVGVDVEAGSDIDWVRREAVGKALGVGITTESLPEAPLQASIEIPGHGAAVVLFNESEAAEALSGTASSRRAE
jgi:4'-phosphopantetheinyl transferase